MIIEALGRKFEVENGENIQSGDTYLAKRNAGWKLLVCEEHVKDGSLHGGFIHSVTLDYSYDTNECFKVITEIK